MTRPTIPYPPRPERDLRTQLTDLFIRRGIDGLEEGDRRREEAIRSGGWKEHAEHVAESIRRAFGHMPFADSGGPLETKQVSSFDTKHCRIENVLFDSYPGWQVNASVFVPKGDGPFPAVVLPVGHSGKQFENYQIPAQAFASAGVLAVLFDPPGQASEKQRGNDHFRDGVRSFLFGLTSNRFFVLDALRCIDYLETRSDADLRHGVAMSGVSGGGGTTLYAAMFDPRIVCFGPSCCLNRMADHPVGNAYSACPEEYWHGRLADGIDSVDVALASIPKPMLYMAGRDDEVFQVEATRSLVDSVAACYRASGSVDRFDYFEDESGHAYTLEQTSRFIGWMNRWMLGSRGASVPAFDRADFEMLDYEMLKCRPSQETTMFTIHRSLAEALETARKHRADPESVTTAAIEGIGRPGPVSSWRESGPFRLWSQGASEALIEVEGLEVPMSVFRPWPPYRASMSIVYIDPAGRRHALESQGPAAPLTNMVDRNEQTLRPEVYVPDLPGWGENAATLTPYEATGWGSMDRLHAYLSYGNGDGVLALLARIVAATADEVSRRTSLPADRTILIGSGLGGTVALLAAAVCATRVRVAAVSSLGSFRMLTDEEFYSWPSISFLPDALNAFDLPELASSLRAQGRRVLIADPRDGAGHPLSQERAVGLFGETDTYAYPPAEDETEAVRGAEAAPPTATCRTPSVGSLLAEFTDEVARGELP